MDNTDEADALALLNHADQNDETIAIADEHQVDEEEMLLDLGVNMAWRAMEDINVSDYPRKDRTSVMWARKAERFLYNLAAVGEQIPPTMNSVISLVEQIITTLKVQYGPGRTPLQEHAELALKRTIEYLMWKFKGEFRVDTDTNMELYQRVHLAAHERRLSAPPGGDNREWIGIRTIEQMGKAWVTYYGVVNDNLDEQRRRAVARILTLVLLGATGAAARDIGLGPGREDYMFLRWLDVDMYIPTPAEDATPGVEDVRVNLTVWHTDERTSHQLVRSLPFSPLPNDRAMACPVRWLIIQAMLSGATEARSADEFVEQLVGSPEGRIRWNTPECPVIPAFDDADGGRDNDNARCDVHYVAPVFYDVPAPAAQLCRTVRESGLMVGISRRIAVHDIQRGAKIELAGVAEAEAARADRAAALGEDPGPAEHEDPHRERVARSVVQTGELGPVSLWERFRSSRPHNWRAGIARWDVVWKSHYLWDDDDVDSEDPAELERRELLQRWTQEDSSGESVPSLTDGESAESGSIATARSDGGGNGGNGNGGSGSGGSGSNGGNGSSSGDGGDGGDEGDEEGMPGPADGDPAHREAAHHSPTHADAVHNGAAHDNDARDNAAYDDTTSDNADRDYPVRDHLSSADAADNRDDDAPDDAAPENATGGNAADEPTSPDSSTTTFEPETTDFEIEGYMTTFRHMGAWNLATPPEVRELLTAAMDVFIDLFVDASGILD